MQSVLCENMMGRFLRYENFVCIQQVQGIYASQPSKEGGKWSTSEQNSAIHPHPFKMAPALAGTRMNCVCFEGAYFKAD
jgi:hypothetical protein